jgi:hypothetical protein
LWIVIRVYGCMLSFSKVSRSSVNALLNFGIATGYIML